VLSLYGNSDCSSALIFINPPFNLISPIFSRVVLRYSILQVYTCTNVVLNYAYKSWIFLYVGSPAKYSTRSVSFNVQRLFLQGMLL
jgi:hypothetical protein